MVDLVQDCKVSSRGAVAASQALMGCPISISQVPRKPGGLFLPQQETGRNSCEVLCKSSSSLTTEAQVKSFDIVAKLLPA